MGHQPQHTHTHQLFCNHSQAGRGHKVKVFSKPQHIRVGVPTTGSFLWFPPLMLPTLPASRRCPAAVAHGEACGVGGVEGS